LASLGRPTEFLLPIEKPTLIHVGCGDEDGPTRLGQHWETYRIDPARQSELEIDLHGNARRVIELEVDGAPMKPGGTLMFQGTYDSSGTRRGSLARLRDGRGVGPILLAPGRYLVTSTDLVDGLLATVLDVPSDGAAATLHLHVTLAAHPRANLG